MKRTRYGVCVANTSRRREGTAGLGRRERHVQFEKLRTTRRRVDLFVFIDRRV